MVYVLAPAVEDVQGEVEFWAFRLDFKRFVDAVSVGGKGVGDPDVAQARTDLNLRAVLDLPARIGDLDRISPGLFWGEVHLITNTWTVNKPIKCFSRFFF